MAEDFRVLDAFWRAANYLSVGQIYLLSNPLLREPLALADVKPRLLGHWGTTPGLNFVNAHLDRVIRARDADVVHVVGPGHGGPGIVANAWLDGTYSERFPDVTLDERGMARLFRQFSFPYGIPSHAAPETPGSINEGGELGYSLAHAYGAAFDNPDTTVVCTIGDGEAETGPLAASWHSNKFVDPRRDGAVLPILHLNGFKIANPTILARIGDEELASLMRGYGHEPAFVSGHEPAAMHVAMAAALDAAFDRIAEIRRAARSGGVRERPRYPMIVLRSPKGWTGPAVVDGLRVEGSWRAHQVPLEKLEDPAHLALLEAWLRSYRPEELFGPDGAPVAELRAFAPAGDRRVSANPHANGGLLRRSLDLPDWRANAVEVPAPGAALAASTAVLGTWLRDVTAREANRDSFRIMGPDETASNRLQDVFEVTGRAWDAIALEDDDAHLSPEGRVMEILSETTCQGWLEGYLLTGRHGLFNCYEAFTHIVDSMAGQHAKWLEQAARVPWRASVSSLTYLLSSHVWRQDHNGFSHQDPGFVDVVATKKPAIVRAYFPPDANTLLAVADHCLRSVDTINVVVAGKQPELQYLGAAEAAAHVAKGIGVWDWASSDAGREPDLVMACAGDVPTLEALAAVQLLREEFPGVAIRFVNVVDLMRLAPRSQHPHGLDDREYDVLFTRDRPVFFAYHGYPSIIHRFGYNRANHANLHVHGFMEEGTTTTPFDMVVRNRLDRYHLALAAIERVPSLAARGARARERCEDALVAHRAHVVLRGEDLPEITGWTWRS